MNFDAANLVLYGKANPVDAVDLLGPYIQGVHAKDGIYPTDPRKTQAWKLPLVKARSIGRRWSKS